MKVTELKESNSFYFFVLFCEQIWIRTKFDEYQKVEHTKIMSFEEVNDR